jgi:predicted dehydrogenase
MAWDAAIIGLGRIASGYDGDAWTGVPRSHAGAILARSDVRLSAVCDPDPDARRAFAENWQTAIPVYESVDALLRDHLPDIAVIACPPASQHAVLDVVIARRPRLIFCEKPFCSSLGQASQAAAAAANVGVPIIVNYHRRFDSRFPELRERLIGLGAPKAVVVCYRKGLFNYGSHIVDLLMYLFGPIVSVESARAAGVDLAAHPDPSLSCRLRFASGFDAQLVGIDDVDYELIEFDILYSRHKFSLALGGYSIIESRCENSVHYPNYDTLVAVQPPLAVGPVSGLEPAYDAIAALLDGHPFPLNPLPTAATSVLVHHVLDAIIRSAASKQRVEV